MMRLFAGGANASLVAKNETKKTFQTSRFLIVISRYLEAKFDYGYFIIYFA